MKRKIIQIANSTQLVSLPRKWATAHNLQKGEEVEVQQHGNQVIISTDKINEKSEIEIDITGLDRTSIMYYIRSAYRCGYETINIKFNDSTCRHFRLGETKNVISVIHHEVNRLVGMEIIQQKDNYCIVKAISEPSQKDFDLLVRRIFRLTIDAFNDLVTISHNGDMVLAETIEEKHDTITKFVSCCLRLINQKGVSNVDESFFMYHIITSIDSIVDIIKCNGRDLRKYGRKMSKGSMKLMEEINECILKYYDFFYTFHFGMLVKLSEKREQIKEMLNVQASKRVPADEIKVLSRTAHILEIMISLVEARTSIAHCSIVKNE